MSVEVDRWRESRSQFVITRGRELIIWQSARTAKPARAHVALPTARASGRANVQCIFDTLERDAGTLPSQRVTTVEEALPVGEDGVKVEGELVAVVEGQSLPDLVGSLTSGTVRHRLDELATAPRAAVVIEDHYSAVYKLTQARPTVVADMLAACQVRTPAGADHLA